MKQNKDREEFEKLMDSYEDGYLEDLKEKVWSWIETHTQKKVEEEHQKLLDILEHNKDPMTGLYDYDGIAQEVIDLVKK